LEWILDAPISILDSVVTEVKGENLDKISAFRLWEENVFANVLVIQVLVYTNILKAKTAVWNSVSVHIDILKAKVGVQNSGFNPQSW